jgi:hypothetical protein
MASSPAAKPGFANGARRFAIGSARRRRALLLVAGGSLVVVVAGPFGTIMLAPLPRAGFWLTLLALNFALWETWFTLLGRRGWHWRQTMFAGLPVFLLALPFEVDLALRLFAGMEAASHFGVFWRGAAVAGVLALAILLFAGRKARQSERSARFPGTAIRLAEIAALVAEDHFVRLHLADGSHRLLHSRFSDAVVAMEPVVGERINRGAWVADAHRGAADYRGRKWFVKTDSGVELAVSRSHAPRLREAGWLTRTG